MRNRRAPEPFRVEDSFAYLIYRNARLLRYHFMHFTAGLELEISQEQFFILNKLGENPGQSQTELGDDILADRPNITRMIATMEANGWLRRKLDPSDARRFQVTLTRKGALIQQRIRDAIVEERERLSAGLTEQEISDLRRILAKMELNVMALIDSDPSEST
ncbi:MAG TPA: MarR family transcriptional regulator [Kofleriaceae bacterium]|nr:MarR family transcriptional regulator [Kofleriaceae bacterium]